MLADYATYISKADKKSRFPYNHAYLSRGLGDISRRLDRWLKCHQFTLMAVTIHALGLMRDIARSSTHVLRLQLSIRLDYSESSSKVFPVESVEVITTAEAMNLDWQWHDSIEFLTRLRKENEAKGKGATAGVGIECPSNSSRWGHWKGWGISRLWWTGRICWSSSWRRERKLLTLQKWPKTLPLNSIKSNQ